MRIEESFRNLKGDLGIRPVFHQRDECIHAHIFISFMAYCLHVALEMRLARKSKGLTPRSILSHLGHVMMLDVAIPLTDGRTLKMERYTKPDKLQSLCLAQLGLTLPEQAPPEIESLVVET